MGAEADSRERSGLDDRSRYGRAEHEPDNLLLDGSAEHGNRRADKHGDERAARTRWEEKQTSHLWSPFHRPRSPGHTQSVVVSSGVVKCQPFDSRAISRYSSGVAGLKSGPGIKPLAVATDTALKPLDGERHTLQMRIRQAQREILSIKQEIADVADGKPLRWGAYRQPNPEKALDRAVTKLARFGLALLDVEAKMAPLEAVYNSEGPWTRAFLVINAGRGHVHPDFKCSTCRPTTAYEWLPTFSGDDQFAIVEAAGERACTVCFENAPVSILSRPSIMFSDAEMTATKAREIRDDAKRVREAKRVAGAATKDGSELRIHLRGYRGDPIFDHGTSFKTEVAAAIWYTDALANRAVWQPKDGIALDDENAALSKIEAALAEKHGVTVEAERARLAKKVADKIKRNAR